MTSWWQHGCSKSGFPLPGSVTTPGMVVGLYRDRETFRTRCSPNEMTDSCRKTGLRYSGEMPHSGRAGFEDELQVGLLTRCRKRGIPPCRELDTLIHSCYHLFLAIVIYQVPEAQTSPFLLRWPRWRVWLILPCPRLTPTARWCCNRLSQQCNMLYIRVRWPRTNFRGRFRAAAWSTVKRYCCTCIELKGKAAEYTYVSEKGEGVDKYRDIDRTRAYWCMWRDLHVPIAIYSLVAPAAGLYSNGAILFDTVCTCTGAIIYLYICIFEFNSAWLTFVFESIAI